jgi:hypothetical protein
MAIVAVTMVLGSFGGENIPVFRKKQPILPFMNGSIYSKKNADAVSFVRTMRPWKIGYCAAIIFTQWEKM